MYIYIDTYILHTYTYTKGCERPKRLKRASQSLNVQVCGGLRHGL